MKTNEIISLLDKLVANANIFSQRAIEAFATSSKFYDCFERMLKRSDEELQRIADIGSFAPTEYREFVVSWAASCTLAVEPKISVDVPRGGRGGRPILQVSFKCEINWASTSRNLSDAAAAVGLYQQVIQLAQRIESLGTIKLEA